MAQDLSWQRKAKDTLAGFVGGAVQVLVGQPFDLVKVRMQTGQFSGVGQAVRQTLAREGPSAFYKGTSAPLFGVGACVSIQFYAYHEAKRQILHRTGKATPSLGQVWVCGAFAGLVNTISTSPIEHARILVQTERSGRYSGAVDAARAVIRDFGISRGLYRGAAVTAARETIAYGTWFWAYESLVATQTSQGIPRDSIPTYKLLVFGALAGEALWLASYPLDVIKSQVQGDPFGNVGSGPSARGLRYHGSALRAAVDTWQRSGIAGFWRGLIPTLLRALPASASTFAAVELTLRALG